MVVDNNQGRFRVWNAATNLESAVITGDGHVLARNIVRGNQARSWSYCDFDGGHCTNAWEIRNGVNVANNLNTRVTALEAGSGGGGPYPNYVRQSELFTHNTVRGAVSNRMSCDYGDRLVAARAAADIDWINIGYARAIINHVPWNHIFIFNGDPDKNGFASIHSSSGAGAGPGVQLSGWSYGMYGFTNIHMNHTWSSSVSNTCNGFDRSTGYDCSMVIQILCADTNAY